MPKDSGGAASGEEGERLLGAAVMAKSVWRGTCEHGEEQGLWEAEACWCGLRTLWDGRVWSPAEKRRLKSRGTVSARTRRARRGEAAVEEAETFERCNQCTALCTGRL